MRYNRRDAVITKLKFKRQFKQLNYYSMPNSILFVLRKRLNFICYVFYLFLFFLKSTL